MRKTWIAIALPAAVIGIGCLGGAMCGCDGDHPGTHADAGADAGLDAGDAQADVAAFRHVTIVHTADLHDHASGRGCFADYTPLDTSDNDPVTGGYARLAALINQVRAEQASNNIPVLLFDSGDSCMGTFYDLFSFRPVTFRFFQLMGYDAVTLGEHEFDWQPSGLAELINNAVSSPDGFDVPIVASNMITAPNDPGDDDIETLVADGVIVDRLVLDLPNGLRVGVLGLLGVEAEGQAFSDPITFDHNSSFVQVMVDGVRNQSGVDLVVVLSHSGVHETDIGEDTELALAVNGIDVIASGHYHEAIALPFLVNGTLIFATGKFGEYLSRLDLNYNMSAARIEDHAFQLLVVDDSVTGDASIQAMVDQYLAGPVFGGMDAATPVVEVPFALPWVPLEETGIGNLVADAMRTTATLIAVDSGDPTPDHAVGYFASTLIGDGIHMCNSGYVTIVDLFDVVPFGRSPYPDNQSLPGWPLVSYCLTPREMKDLSEVTVSLAVPFAAPDRFLNFSGIRIEFDPSAPTMPPDRVVRIWLCGNTIPVAQGGDGDIHSLNCTTQLDLNDSVTLLRVVTDLSTSRFIHALASDAGLSINPVHCDGTPITDLMDARIDRDPAAAGIQEHKLLHALFEFLMMMPDTGGLPGVPEIPDCYDSTLPGACLGRLSPI